MLPKLFQTPRVLRVLNIAGVGLALSSAVACMLAQIYPPQEPFGALVTLPSLALGVLWAWLLRIPSTVGDSSVRWGWIASIPLAILNASMSAGLLFEGQESHWTGSEFLLGAIAGATFGSLFWIPGLLFTLVCFGLPIARAQRLARKGLAGEERGERTVGLVCALISVCAVLILFDGQSRSYTAGVAHLWLLRAVAVLGVLAGGGATALAAARAARRRAFVAGAEAGKIPGYRVDRTDEGQVLVRVVTRGQAYRIADFEEPLFELDEQGEAIRPKAMFERHL